MEEGTMKWLDRIESEIQGWFTSPDALRTISAELRSLAPIASVAGWTIVSRYDDVREVLANDRDFGVTEVYAARMDRTTGAFFLGMENTPEYQREAGIARNAVRVDDARRIGQIVESSARELLAGARKRGGVLDAVAEFSRVIPIALLRDYFGVPGPDPGTMQRWMRYLFWDIFLNQGDDATVRAKSSACSAEFKAYLESLIRERKAQVSRGDAPDDFVTRMLRQQAADPTIDDDLIRRNIGGVVVGAVDTLSKAVAHVTDELLRRPAAFESARRAAAANDEPALAGHVWEALRFNPHNAVLFRRCHQDAVIAEGTDRRTVIAKGSTVVALMISAMFDPAAFERPDDFLTNRPSDSYLHFGHGQHLCFGTRINAIVLPLAIKAIVGLDHLAYDERGSGKIEYEGPFPDRMLLRFDVPQ
jgi:cytochrome P450